MFGLGFSEIAVILVVAIVVLGPKHLPEAAKTLGRTVGMLRRTLDDLKHEMALPPIESKEKSITAPATSKNDLFDDDEKSEQQPKQ